MLPPLEAFVSAAAPGSFESLLLALVATIAATKLLGELAQRIGQPTVLGELVAGMLLGASALGILDPADPVIHALAELGVLVLLFEIGLHTNLRSLASVGPTAITVGVVGVVLPFALGVLAALALGLDKMPAVVAAAALTATSIGISARVLSDLGWLQTKEGQVVIGAAVLDDVVGLVVLSVVGSVVAGGDLTVGTVASTAAPALGFVVISVALGSVAIAPLFRFVDRVRVSGALGILALGFALALAWVAMRSGSAMIIGAFAAGLILHPTLQRKEIERSVTQLGFFFVPIFFASVGAEVDLEALASAPALRVGAALIGVGVLGKIAAGYAPVWFKGDKLLVGLAMVPRGEVGLIFAQLGLSAGVLTPSTFGALMLMVVATTFAAPPLLGLLVRHRRPDDGATRDASGIDDLVVGTSPRTDKR